MTHLIKNILRSGKELTRSAALELISKPDHGITNSELRGLAIDGCLTMREAINAYQETEILDLV